MKQTKFRDMGEILGSFSPTVWVMDVWLFLVLDSSLRGLFCVATVWLSG